MIEVKTVPNFPTQVCRVLAERERHLLEDWQEDVGSGRVGHHLRHGRRQQADDQVDGPHRQLLQVDQPLHQPRRKTCRLKYQR